MMRHNYYVSQLNILILSTTILIISTTVYCNDDIFYLRPVHTTRIARESALSLNIVEKAGKKKKDFTMFKDDASSKGYCDLRECNHWTGLTLILLSPRFAKSDFPSITKFIWDSFEECLNYGGQVAIMPINAEDTLEKTWSQTKAEFTRNFQNYFHMDDFVLSKFPSPRFLLDVVNKSLPMFGTSPLGPEQNGVHGFFIIIITNYEIYLDQETATLIRNLIMNHHIRLKVMLIDNYNEEFSSESSDQDYFEMIAERGEKTEVNSVNALFTNKITSKMGACYNYKYEAKKTMKKISPDKKWVYVGASVSILAAIIIFSLICYLIILRRKKVREQKISDLRWSNDMVSENNEYEEHTNKKNTNWVIGKKHSNNEFNSANGISQIEGIEMSERRGKDQVVPHPQLLAQTDSNASTIKQSPSLSNLNQDVDLSSLLTINYNENIGAGNFSYVLKGTLDIGGKDGVNKPLWYDNNINQAFAKGDNDETINQGRKSKDNDGNLMYNGNDSKFVIDVAIKMSLTVGNVYQKHESKEFLEKELEILKAVCGHEHVVYFHGSCIKDNSLCLILEYCSGGDLLKYIQNPQHQSQLSEKQLLKFAYQIADGMYYLAHLGLIHRDLSARNILLKDSDNLIAKIGDFGLSRILEETENVEVQNEYMLRRNAKIPVKWTAIEALNDGVYTEKSDVWAFSVLLFELFSFGQTPYKDMCLLSILPYLNLGKRLHRPSHANDNIWELMEQCWLEDPVNRPSFEKIRANLTKQLEDATEIYGYCLLESIKE